MGTAVPLGAPNPSPSNGQSPATVSDGDDQKLVIESHLGAIGDQTNLTHALGHRLKQVPGNRGVPFAYPHRWVGQKPAQTPNNAEFFGSARDLAGNIAQVNRFALIDPDEQPDEVSHPSDALIREQLPNLLKPGMIETVGRHWFPPCKAVSESRQLYSIGACRSTPCC